MNTLMLNGNRSNQLKLAGKLLQAGGLVAIPTETVYGLAANALDEKALRRLFRVKGRPADNPLIVHVSKPEEIAPLVLKIPPAAEKLMDMFWPGPLTLVLPKSDLVPRITTAGMDTVAVRCPAHIVARRVIEEAGVPLAAPSANHSGKPSPTTAVHVKNDFDGMIEAIVDGGQCEVGIESTVLNLSGEHPVLLRPGGVSAESLRAVLADLILYDELPPERRTMRSPGLKHRHYAPKAPLCIVRGTPEEVSDLISKRARHAKVGVLCFNEEEKLYEGIETVAYGNRGDSASLASGLFDALRQLDGINAIQLYTRYPEGQGLMTAVRDRLMRAADYHTITLSETDE